MVEILVFLGPPIVHKAQEHLDGGVVHMREQPAVEVLERSVLAPGSFVVDGLFRIGVTLRAKRECGLVPEEVRCRLPRAFDGARHDESPWSQCLAGRVPRILDIDNSALAR